MDAVKTISSVASTRIGNVVLTKWTASDCSEDFWTELDNVLIKLVERLGHRDKLRVEFRNTEIVEGTEFDGGVYLPKFAERGQVMVSNELKDL